MAEKQITDQIAGFEVVDRDNASASAYVKNLIINLGNVPESRIGELKEVISGELSDLPQGEKKPDNADLLIILGNDYVK